VTKKGQQKLKNCSYLFINSLFNQLGLNKLCQNIAKQYEFHYDFSEILATLVSTRILFPGSKKQSYEDAQNYLEKPSFQQHDIYRSLDVLAENSELIQEHVYKQSLHLVNRNTRLLYYDCTNYYFEIEQESGMKKYGKSKEHRPNPIVQMGLFMDGNGLPLAFSVFDGNQNEQTSMRPLEKRIMKDFDLSQFVVCTDAGLSSDANKRFNDRGDRAFITTVSIKKIEK